jgi:hypothetical protein
MRTVKFALLILCLTSFLTGCSHYTVRGTFQSHYNGTTKLNGTLTRFPLEGKSYISMHSLDGKLWCRGVMYWTHVPNLSFSCDEEEGSLTMDCNNERVVVSNWASTGCNQGYGHGYTDHGALFYFDYYPEPLMRRCDVAGKVLTPV